MNHVWPPSSTGNNLTGAAAGALLGATLALGPATASAQETGVPTEDTPADAAGEPAEQDPA